MESSNSQRADELPAPGERRRTIVVRVAVAFILLIVGWCLWLFFPDIWMRIRVSRIAGAYVVNNDPVTGMPATFAYRNISNRNRVAQWENELGNESIPRLLGLLESGDPLRVWLGAQALRQQIELGQRQGWPGKLVPAEPLDAAVAEAALNTLEHEESPMARDALVQLLRVVRLDSPGTREILLKGLDHPDEIARTLATRVLPTMDPDAAQTFEIVNTLWRDSSVAVRRSAFSAVLELSSKTQSRTIPARYLPLVQEAANDSSPSGRFEAARALACMNLDWDLSFELAAKLLQDDEQRVREGTMSSLVSGSPISWTGAPRRTAEKLPVRYQDPVSTLLNDSDESLREVAFRVLLPTNNFPPDRLWPFVENAMKSPKLHDLGWQLRRALFSSEEPVNLFIDSNSRIGSSDPVDVGQLRSRLRPLALEARPRLLEWATAAIKDEDEPTAIAGIQMLEWIIEDQSELVTPALFHPAVKVRCAALGGFRKPDETEVSKNQIAFKLYGTPGYRMTEEQFARTVALLDDSDAGDQYAAAWALTCWQGAWSAEQIDRLIAVMRHGDESIRDGVFELIRSVAPDAPELHEAAMKALHGDSVETRRWGVRALAKLGDKAIDAVPQLLEGIRTGRLDAAAAHLVVKSGQPIGSPDDVQCLMTELLDAFVLPGQQGSKSVDSNLVATHMPRIKELVALCPREPAIKSLLDGLNHSNASARTVAAHVLAAQPGDSTGVVVQLVAISRTGRWEARHAALLCLADMGTAARDVRDASIERLHDEEIPVRAAAAEVLGKLGTSAGPEAAAALARMARDDNYPGCQSAAIRALGNMGNLADPWTSTLQQLSKNSDRNVQREANQALSALGSAEK